MEGWRGSEAEKQSQVDSEDNLQRSSEMESLFPLAFLAVTTVNSEASPVFFSMASLPSTEVTRIPPPLHFLQPREGGKPLLSRTTLFHCLFPIMEGSL